MPDLSRNQHSVLSLLKHRISSNRTQLCVGSQPKMLGAPNLSSSANDH